MSRKYSMAFLAVLLLGLRAGTASAEMTYYLGIYNDTDYYVMVDIPAKNRCTILIGGAEKDGSHKLEKDHSYKLELEPKSRDRKVVLFRRHGGSCDGKQGHLKISAVANSDEYKNNGFRDWQHFWYSNAGNFTKHGRNSQYKSTLERTPGVAGRGNYDLRITKVIALAGAKRATATTTAAAPTANLQMPFVVPDNHSQLVNFTVNGHVQNASRQHAKLLLHFGVKDTNGEWQDLAVNTSFMQGGRNAEISRDVPISSDSHPLRVGNMTIPYGAFQNLPRRSEPYELAVLAELQVGEVSIQSQRADFKIEVY